MAAEAEAGEGSAGASTEEREEAMTDIYRASCVNGHRWWVDWLEVLDTSCPVCNEPPIFEDKQIQALRQSERWDEERS